MRWMPRKHKIFVHLYNAGPTSKTFGRCCTNLIQMFCVCWVLVPCPIKAWVMKYCHCHSHRTLVLVIHFNASPVHSSHGKYFTECRFSNFQSYVNRFAICISKFLVNDITIKFLYSITKGFEHNVYKNLGRQGVAHITTPHIVTWAKKAK